MGVIASHIRQLISEFGEPAADRYITSCLPVSSVILAIGGVFDPIPQVKATAKLGEFLESKLSQSFSRSNLWTVPAKPPLLTGKYLGLGFFEEPRVVVLPNWDSKQESVPWLYRFHLGNIGATSHAEEVCEFCQSAS